MTTFSVHKELGGGTVIPLIKIYNVPERLIKMFDTVDMRTPHEKDRDERLSRVEVAKRIWYSVLVGTYC
jgi:hypothetical protein